MADEQEMNDIANEMQMHQSKGEIIRQQIQAMQSNILEISSTMDVLRNIKKASKGDTLLPIGAGVMLACPKPDPSRVVVNVGANVMVEKKPEDALLMLEDRQKRIMKAVEESQKNLQEVVQAIEGLTKRASLIAAEGGRGNVRPSEE